MIDFKQSRTAYNLTVQPVRESKGSFKLKNKTRTLERMRV
jgi:hypothetical protein